MTDHKYVLGITTAFKICFLPLFLSFFWMVYADRPFTKISFKIYISSKNSVFLEPQMHLMGAASSYAINNRNLERGTQEEGLSHNYLKICPEMSVTFKSYSCLLKNTA